MFDLQSLKRAHKRFEARHAAMVDQALADAGQEGVRHASGPGKGYRTQTGALEKANEYRVIRTRGGHLLRLKNRKKYAAAIDKGARAHRIAARRAKVLRFYSRREGRFVFRRVVNHPGNRAYKFLQRGIAQSRRHFHTNIRREAAALARRF